jgi:hypothetical protein
MLNSKGQEAAPFELLVAVIIMAFVIFVGLQAMADLNMQKCYNETDAKLERMKTSLETTVNRGSPQQINFVLSSCFNPQNETIRVKEFNEPAMCASYCNVAKELCTLLQYYYSGEGGFSIMKCLNISPDSTFPYREGVNCPAKPDYKLVDFRSGIEQGNYLLVNKTSVASPNPIVCAYRKGD